MHKTETGATKLFIDEQFSLLENSTNRVKKNSKKSSSIELFKNQNANSKRENTLNHYLETFLHQHELKSLTNKKNLLFIDLFFTNS